ncbi:MAG TPA: NUDIX domain-containing protein [Clostridia bacterium]|nr:NUDIX domain-containing protein [Clostridia bacterium]
MSIRLAAKALVVREGKLLLNRCRSHQGHPYYSFPGGGQNLGETLEEAVAREVLEETGLTVRFERFVAFFEEIAKEPAFQAEHPDYFHKSYHFCRCALLDDAPVPPSEMDSNQEGSVWVPLEDVAELPLYPEPVRAELPRLLSADAPVYLGSVRR